MLKIGIGILAYNEAENIHNILDNIFSQSIFHAASDEYDIEIIVVPNGCTDNTAGIAREQLERLGEMELNSRITWAVAELAKGDKAGAWNHYVHQASRSDTDYYILVDADIEILHDRSFERMIQGLVDNTRAEISHGRGVKHSSLKDHKGLLDLASIYMSRGTRRSGTAQASRPGDILHYVSGQLYCGRASALKKIWLPSGLPAEDGFLSTCITTQMFKSEMAGDRIIRVADAKHMFVAETTMEGWLHHEERMTIGATINGVLKDFFEARRDTIEDVGQWIREKEEHEPFWLRQVMENSVKAGTGLVSFSWGIRRIRALNRVRPIKAAVYFPIYLAFLPVDFYIRHKCNKTISSSQGIGFW